MSSLVHADIRMRSRDELLSVAAALEREAAARYRALSNRMARQGDSSMAAQFDGLAGMEDAHAGEVAKRSQELLGHAPAICGAGWELPPTYDEEEARGATLSPYQALAFAVRNEERAFVFYTYVAAEAEDPAVHALAEELARDELEHAALLRRHRRRAFHSERPIAAEIPQSVEDLRAAAQGWDGEAAAAHAALANALDDAGETKDAAIFRRLAAQEEKAAAGATGAAIPKLRSAADGLRLLEEAFDRFALISERSNDEDVVAEAQRLAGETVARLALAEARAATRCLASPRADRVGLSLATVPQLSRNGTSPRSSLAGTTCRSAPTTNGFAAAAALGRRTAWPGQGRATRPTTIAPRCAHFPVPRLECPGRVAIFGPQLNA